MVTDSIKQDEVIQVERNPWADNFFRPLLIVAMIMCFNITVVNLVWLVNPNWRGSYFLLGMFLTTVEGIYSYRMLQRYRSKGVSVLRYRLVEIAIIILALKFLNLIGKPLAVIQAEIWGIIREPSSFLTTEFYMILSLAMLAWLTATHTIADFDSLYDAYRDNRTTLDALAERFFWGGGMMMFFSGITQWVALAGADSLLDVDRASLGGVVLNVLIYFVLGLMLLSQVNLTRLRVRWQVQKLTVAPHLAQHWARYGLIILTVITVVAFALPTSYSLGLLETTGMILGFLINISVFILQLLIVLVTFPIAWLLSLLGMQPAASEAGSPRLVMPEVPAAQGSSPWLELLRSLVFWSLALAGVVYLIKTYLDDHPELLAQIKGLKPIALLLKLLQQLWQGLGGWVKKGLEALPHQVKFTAAVKRMQGVTDDPGRWLALRRLSPREQILRYYFNILQQAAKYGAPRKETETPYEYEPNLSQNAPSVQAEIHEMTDTFVHARYSNQTFSRKDAKSMKQRWRQIKKSLRQARSNDSPNQDAED